MAKQHYCFLKKFNNYFNRKIIVYSELDDYIEAAEAYFIPQKELGKHTPFDFNPNDNVTTEVIVNDVPFDPDYFILFDEEISIVSRWFVLEQKRNRQGQWIYQLKRDVIADNIDNILPAPIFVEKGMLQEDDPFIVNDEGMSLNQIKKNEILLKDKSKTAWIVGYMAKNAGGSDVNIQVDDETIPIDYITLGDIASAIDSTEGVLNSLLNFNGDNANKAYFTNSVKMKLWMYYRWTNYDFYLEYSLSFSPEFDSGKRDYVGNSSISGKPYLFKGANSSIMPDNNDSDYFINAAIANKALWLNDMSSILNRSYYFTQNQLNILKQFSGSIVKYNGKYYKFAVSETGTNTVTKEKLKKDGTYNCLDTSANDAVTLSSGRLLTGTYSASDPNAYLLAELKSNETTVVLNLNLISDYDTIPQLNTVISSARRTTGDQEYDVFAIPLDISIQTGPSDYFSCEEVYARRIASAIGIQQSQKVYDLQLLPYCPVLEYFNPNTLFPCLKISDLTEHEDYDLIVKNMSDVKNDGISSQYMTWTHISGDDYTCIAPVHLNGLPAGKTPIIDEIKFVFEDGTISNVSSTISGDDIAVSFDYNGPDPTGTGFGTVIVYWHYQDDDIPCGIIFYLRSSTFSTIIEQEIDVEKSKKVVSNCYNWRLNSPNYQGAFNFNIAKNGGKVRNFNVFCTYKPFTPFIKVAPNFEWLYGMEYQDNRGLICAGDFSLPRVQDEWVTYQLNNKNYQNIFNRDIQHLEFMQSIEMRNQLVSGAVGIFSDAVKGGVAGGIVGGGWGAAAGALLGGAASAVGYGIDVDTMARTHRENKQLAIDKFNYQLGNIKALPYTLTKVGSFDAISKIFPFIEEYSCSDQELEAFEKKIQYESMTVMRIGALEDYANFDGDIHYFKGSLIRNDEIADDTHILNAIYEELLKGVYI